MRFLFSGKTDIIKNKGVLGLTQHNFSKCEPELAQDNVFPQETKSVWLKALSST